VDSAENIDSFVDVVILIGPAEGGSLVDVRARRTPA
jgi:hypothetical protein